MKNPMNVSFGSAFANGPVPYKLKIGVFVEDHTLTKNVEWIMNTHQNHWVDPVLHPLFVGKLYDVFDLVWICRYLSAHMELAWLQHHAQYFLPAILNKLSVNWQTQ